jgi:TPP-dependent trihydroxycyclohexane-1,2-dione (THcHDO) dehydratase
MRVVLTAAKMLLDRRKSYVSSLEFKLKYRTDTSMTAKSAGARTAAANDLPELRANLDKAKVLAQEAHDAIKELRATEVGAEIWKELERS